MALVDRAEPNEAGRLTVTAWLANPEGMDVMEAQALQCPDDYWWVPRYGYSVPAARLHETEGEARAELLATLRRDRDALVKRIAELEAPRA